MADTSTATTTKRRPARESEAPDVLACCKLYDRLLADRGMVDTLQQEIAEYLFPRRAIITVQREEGADQTEKVWDSTGIHANELLAASIQGSLMSQAIRWFALKLRDSRFAQASKAVTDWLEQVEERIYLALRQSNFNAEGSEVCLDLGAFGIGAMLVEENPKQVPGFNGFRFTAIAPGTYVIAENAQGRVDTLIRCFKLSARAIKEKFPAAELPGTVTAVLETNPEKTFEVLHCVKPRRVDNPKRKGPFYKPWASLYILKASKTLLDEGGVDSFPFLVPRWAKTSGETYGRGPGHTALPAIRTLSRAIELTLSAASKALDPPGLVNSDSVFGELDVRPGSQNPVEGDPATAWKPMESGAKFDVAEVLKQNYQRQIQIIFYWDQLQLQGDKLMTATEVERRLELMRRVLGPTLGRFESEFLTPLLQLAFTLMYRAGALPKPPKEIQGQDLDVEYEGPLARSQKATRLAALDEVLAKVTALAAFAPEKALEVLDNFDLDTAFRDQAEIAGLPSTYQFDKDYVGQVRAARQQAAAQRAKMEQMTQLAEAVGKGAPGITALQEAAQGNGQQMGQAA
jgi:hypothetical protein